MYRVILLGSTSFLLALPAISGCTDASNPTLNATRSDFYQTESKTIFVPGSGQLLTAFGDQQGVYRKSGNNLVEIQPGFVFINGQLRWQGQTFAGLSSSSNLGLSWTNYGQLQPRAPQQCAIGTDCPLLIRGDPWLATNGTRVLYSALAHTQFTRLADINNAGAFPSDALAVARSENGTASFGAFYVAARLPGQFVDKPSVDMVGDTAIAAFQEVSGSPRIFTVTTDTSGTDAWYPPELLFLPFSLSRAGDPYVKLATPTLAYVAYLEAFLTSIPSALPRLFINVVVARLTRTMGSPTWNAEQIYRRNGTEMDSAAAGGQSRSWRDLVPFNFSLGFDRKELHLAFRRPSETTNDSDVEYSHCVDEPVGTCSTTGDGQSNPNWIRTPLPAIAQSGETFTGQRFQPWVEGHPTKRSAGVSWYQQRSPASAEYVLAGAHVDTATNSVVAATPLTPAFTACPTSGADKDEFHFFGDYESTAFMFDVLQGTTQEAPVFVTTFARSTQCASAGQLTRDQFIGSVIW